MRSQCGPIHPNGRSRLLPQIARQRRGGETNVTTRIEPSTHGRVHVNFKKRYANYIGGQWVPPIGGAYFENVTPVTGHALCEIPRSGAEDIEAALDAAHAAKAKWGTTSAAAGS